MSPIRSSAFPSTSLVAAVSASRSSRVVPSEPMILLEIKNISQDPLNIPAEELMERFKRGDESRNTEGSGLGLAIAKDLVKLMEGIFEISIDGDLFKAAVMMKKAEN